MFQAYSYPHPLHKVQVVKLDQQKEVSNIEEVFLKWHNSVLDTKWQYVLIKTCENLIERREP